MILEKLVEVLQEDATVAAGLAAYRFTTGDPEKPAVFTVDPVPNDAELPAIVLTLDGGSPWGTRAKRGVEGFVDLRLWGDKARSTESLRTLAWDVWKAVNRVSLDLDGFEEVGIRADGPERLTDTDGFPGFRIRLSYRVLEA